MPAFTIRIAKKLVETDADSVEIGTHSSCAAHLRDPVASSHHARIARAGGGFSVEDLGSATGTWRNGEELRGRAVLASGDVLVTGCTRSVVTIDAAGSALQLEVQEQGFFFEPSRAHKGESGAMQVGGDAERWVRDEVAFGRFPALALGNKIALGAALIFLVALLLPFGRGAVLQPGPLAAAHARLFDSVPNADTPARLRHAFEIARDQGCSACHGALGGAPAQRCAACHDTLVAQNHPFYGDRSAAAATAGIALDDDVCASCHLDHSGATPVAGTFIPGPEELQASCARCHAEVPASDRITRKPVRFEPVAHELVYDRFPHDKHADQRCDVCHQRDTTDGDSSAAAAGRDFGKVEFARCMGCHSADATPTAQNRWGRDPALAEFAAKVKPEHRVRLAWHGSAADSGSASRCLDCHAEVHAKELRRAERQDPESLAFALKRRAHSELFTGATKVADPRGRQRGCVECHASGGPLHAGETIDGRFWHEVHMTGVRPDGPAASDELSEACAGCHVETASSRHLAGGAGSPPHYDGPPLDSCAQCHSEKKLDENGGERREPLVLAAKPEGPTSERDRIDFPHAAHVRSTPAATALDPLAGGCFACHSFESGERAFQAAPTTRADAASCLPCHLDHANVGGPGSTGCALCHPDDAADAADPVWSGKKAIRMRADTPGFSHWSRGHARSTDANDCATCHGGVEKARTVADVPIPSEADDACFSCHKDERFHWRGAPAAAAAKAR